MTITKTEKVMGIIILVLLFTSIFQFYNRPQASLKTETKNVQVEIPAKSGIFLKPESKQELPPKKTDSLYYHDRLIVVASKADKETVNQYRQAKDSIAKLNVLLDATREREYLYKFDDDTISLSMTATAFGRVTSIIPKYEVKKTTVTVPQTTITRTVTEPAKLKDVVSINGHVGVLVGGSYMQDLQTKTPAYGINAGIRVEKITVLAGLNTQKQGTVTALIEL